MRTVIAALPFLFASLLSTPETLRCEVREEDRFYESVSQQQLALSLLRIRPGFSVTSKRFDSSEDRVEDLRLSLSGCRTALSVRYSRKNMGERSTFCLEHVMRSMPVRLTAGYFVPDLGLGLIYSPVERIYAFDAGFPLRDYRHFVRRTSFYGESLRGIAAMAGVQPFRVILFSGEAGRWKDASYHRAKEIISGLRLEWMKGITRTGITISGGGRVDIAGFDLIRKMDDSAAGIEIAVDRDLGVSMIAGFKRRWSGTSFGLRLYGGRYGDISGLDRIASESRDERRGAAGFLLYLGRRPGRNLRVAAAAGSSITRAGGMSLRREEYRLEYRWKWKGVQIRGGYSTRSTSEEDMIPFPPDREKEVRRYSSVKLLIKGRFSRITRYRVSLRSPHGSDGKGRTGAIGLGIGGIDSASRLDPIATIYEAIEGNPPMYVYEPVLRGGYPWHRYSGRGVRLTMISRISAAGSLISLRVYRSDKGEGGADMQFLREF